MYLADILNKWLGTRTIDFIEDLADNGWHVTQLEIKPAIEEKTE